MCVCLSVCLSSRLEKINTTGVASVKPGKATESTPNEVSSNEIRQKFGQKTKV